MQKCCPFGAKLKKKSKKLPSKKRPPSNGKNLKIPRGLFRGNRGISSTCRAIGEYLPLVGQYVILFTAQRSFGPAPGEQYHVLPAKWKIFVLLSTIHPLNTPFV